MLKTVTLTFVEKNRGRFTAHFLEEDVAEVEDTGDELEDLALRTGVFQHEYAPEGSFSNRFVSLREKIHALLKFAPRHILLT
jgi:hypothetical protein